MCLTGRWSAFLLDQLKFRARYHFRGHLRNFRAMIFTGRRSTFLLDQVKFKARYHFSGHLCNFQSMFRWSAFLLDQIKFKARYHFYSPNTFLIIILYRTLKRWKMVPRRTLKRWKMVPRRTLKRWKMVPRRTLKRWNMVSVPATWKITISKKQDCEPRKNEKSREFYTNFEKILCPNLNDFWKTKKNRFPPQKRIFCVQKTVWKRR